MSVCFAKILYTDEDGHELWKADCDGPLDGHRVHIDITGTYTWTDTAWSGPEAEARLPEEGK